MQVRLLGEAAELLAPGAAPQALERRTAGLLAFLALEGPTPRARLAGLLWPDSGEERARTNMRQLLRRLKLAAGGAEVAPGGDVVRLAPGLAVDAAALAAHGRAGRNAEVLALSGELLGTLDYGDCPDFARWLAGAREALALLRRRAATAAADACEAAGELGEALEAAERLLQLEPYSEEAHRRLMRLHHQRGDRGAAREAYARCRRALREELDAAPSPETEALARLLAEEPAPPPSLRRAAARAPLPASVLRPPVLVGREREWAQLEASRGAHPVTVLLGEPGAGKTRLALDFATSKGPHQVLWGRPGDARVPYATYVRHLRQRLAARPELPARLPPWVRAELARLLPEVAPAGRRPPPPVATEGERQRFLAALAEALAASLEGFDTLVCDDLHFFDTATMEVGEFAQGYFRGRDGGLPHVLDVTRRGELAPDVEAAMARVAAAGLLGVVEVGPLPPQAVEALLDTLALPGAPALAGELSRYTGGNPLFLTETLKHLLELGSLERGWPGRLPPTGRVRALIQQRLARLSPAALGLAQVAALAGTHFSLEVAAEVLETGLLPLAGAVAELEAAQVLRHERFTHDLVFEAVREALPTSLAPLLHRRLAAAFERRAASGGGGAASGHGAPVPPAVVARHWQGGGLPARAAERLLEAAAQLEASGLRHADAAGLYAEAAALLAGSGEEAAAARAAARERAARAGATARPPA
jgi:DNA-binding SARP family transcriptional activator